MPELLNENMGKAGNYLSWIGTLSNLV